MHAAALIVLGDLNEDRLKVNALQQLPTASNAAVNKGDVQIVSTMAQPFRIEGLFGDLKEGVQVTEEVEMQTA